MCKGLAMLFGRIVPVMGLLMILQYCMNFSSGKSMRLCRMSMSMLFLSYLISRVGKVSNGCFDFFCFVEGHHVVDIVFEFVVIEGVDFVGGSDEYSDLWV